MTFTNTQAPDTAVARRAMVREQLKARGIRDTRVLAAFERIPRELFVPDVLRANAYEDRPLPIGEGQTISQPYIVALTVESLELRGTERVLEIGTGWRKRLAVSMSACIRLLAGLIAGWCLGCAGPQPRPATDGRQPTVTKSQPRNERPRKPTVAPPPGYGHRLAIAKAVPCDVGSSVAAGEARIGCVEYPPEVRYRNYGYGSDAARVENERRADRAKRPTPRRPQARRATTR